MSASTPGFISRGKRKRVLARFPFCVYCGGPFEDRHDRTATVDHVIPVSQGGTTEDSNLVGCCRACNVSKRDRTPEQWAADIMAACESAVPSPQ